MGGAAAAASGVQLGASIMAGQDQLGSIGTATDRLNSQYALQIQGLQDMMKGTQKQWDPYQKMGTDAMSKLSTPGGVQMDPGYQFAAKSGMDAMNQNAGARGHFFSPQTMEALTAYGQGVGQQGYQQAFQNLMQQVGVGQNATGSNTMQQIGMQGALNDVYGNRGQTGAQSAMAAGAARQGEWGAVGSAAGGASGGGGGKGGGGGGKGG
jgi:hypothetical protein